MLQLVGAFGEWAAIVELLRRGWTPANVNQTINNNQDVDIFAQKRDRKVSISVKTLRESQSHWTIGGFKRGVPIQPLPVDHSHFTILVTMGREREGDQFYVIPSHVVRQECALRQREVYPSDRGAWNMRLADRKDGEVRAGWGIRNKWKQYCEAWEGLEEPVNQLGHGG
jgi:hypothetical protein